MIEKALSLDVDEFALILIKPDAVERGLESEIFSGLEMEGLSVEKIGAIQLTPQLVLDFYRWKRFEYADLIKNYICTSPLPVWIACGDGAVGKVMRLKMRLRSKYCTGPLKNLFHSPNTLEESKLQYNFLEQRNMIMKNKLKKRTPNQVEAIVYSIRGNSEPSFLMLKRNPDKGGFWQPVTGNVEENESFESAAIREVEEELGVKNILQFVDTGYSYEFTDNNIDQFERVFGVQVSPNQVIRLSPEHTEFKWVSKDEALNVYLKYPGNKKGLRQLYKKIIAIKEGRSL